MLRITPYSFLQTMIYTYDFQIADLLIRVESLYELADLFELSNFQVHNAAHRPADALYCIENLPREWTVKGTKLSEDEHSAVYLSDGVIHRYYFWNVFTRDRYVLLTIPPKQSDPCRIYLQEDTLHRILPQFRLSAFMLPERLLLKHNALFLHSSIIEHHGQGIVFSAPSGVGKSTQADLWHRLEGAEILNGDKTIIRNQNGCFLGYGSPYAGTSGIYKNKSVSIRAIVVLSQAKENSISRLSPSQAYRKLLSQVSALPWDPQFMTELTEQMLQIVKQIPVFHLACLPDSSAVDTLKAMLNAPYQH